MKILQFTVVLILACGIVNAADVTSVNDGLWTSASTWDVHIPTASDAPWIANGKTVTVDSSITTGSLQYVSVGNWSPTSGTLTITSTGSLATTTAGIYDGCGGAGIINVNGGYLNCVYAFKCGWYGNGTLNITDGMVDVGGLYVGTGTGTNSNVNILGGIVRCWSAPGLVMGSGIGHVKITEGKLQLPGIVGDITAFGDVKAYKPDNSLDTFYYDTTTSPGHTIISAAHTFSGTLSVKSGYWSDPNIWSTGVKPTVVSSDVDILGNDVVTVNTNEALSSSAAFNLGGRSDNSGATLAVVSGGTLNINGEAFAGLGTATAYINVNGGTLNANWSLRLGWDAGSKAVATITSGTVTFGNLLLGPNGSTGELHINGGTVNANGLTMNTNGWIDIAGGALPLHAIVTDVTTYGHVTAYGGRTSFIYDTTSQPGYTLVTAKWLDPIDPNIFAAGITRPRLEKMLQESLVIQEIAQSPQDYTSTFAMINDLGQGHDPNMLIKDVACSWDVPASASNPNMADEDAFYSQCAAFADRAHQNNLYCILEARVCETAYAAYAPETPQRVAMGPPQSGAGVEQIPVPAWVFQAFGETPVTRNFSYEDMIYANGLFRNRWLPGASVPDISRPEGKKWYYYRARRYIDAGFEALDLQQIHEITYNDRPNYTNTKQVMDMIRAYAAQHARRKWVFTTAGTYGITDSTNHLIFDYHQWAFRPKGVAGSPGQAILEMNYQDSIYGKSIGGITPSGWTCTSLPYSICFDNIGGANGSDHTVNTVTPYVWNWDEISWFAHQPEKYRNDWLWYSAYWVRAHDTNGYVSMTLRNICQDPLFFGIPGITDDDYTWYYRVDTYVSPDYGISNYGMNQYETIKAIRNSPCLGYNSANLNNDCRVNFSDLALVMQKWQNTTDCTNHYALDRQDFNGDCVVNMKDLAIFVQNWLSTF